MMDGVAELGAVANAMSEEAGELFHLAGGVRHFGCNEAAEISSKKVIAVEFGGLVVALRRNVLSDLAEDPGVRRRGAADHDGIASGFGNHANGILWRANVTIANNRDAHGLFHIADYAPIRCAAIALHASARMNGDCFDAGLLGHLGDVNCDDIVLVPAGTNFDRERDSDNGANGAEENFEMRQVAQKARAAALDDFFHRTAEIDVHVVEAEILGEGGGGSHHFGIRAEDLRGDGMLVVVEIKVVQGASGIAREAFGAGEFGHDEAAAAETADYAAEDSIGNAGHRSEDGSRANDAIANREF